MDLSTVSPIRVRLNVSWARLVSNAISPPVVWALLAFPIAFYDPTDERALLWALLYGTFVCWLPTAYILWSLRTGAISDLHMPLRRERFRPLAVTMLGSASVFGLFLAAGAPRIMALFALCTLAQLFLMTVITLRWQISVHTMSIACAAVTTALLFGPLAGLALAPLVLLVAAARLKLGRHTAAEVIAGGLLATAVTLVMFLFV